MRMLSFLTNLWENNMTLLLLILILIIVIPFLIFYLTKAKEHPKGLVAAALSNMGERFGYYIMNAVLLKGTKVQHGAGLFSGTAWLAGSGEQGQRWAAQCGLWPFRQQGLES